MEALAPRTEEARRVDYLLRLSLGAAPQDIHDVQAWHFGGQAGNAARLAARFEEATKGRGGHLLHAWVDASELDASNSLENLASKGFTVGKHGMRFATGALDAASRKRGGRGNDGGAKRLVLCMIGPGRAKVVDREEDARVPPPEGFDSVFLARPAPEDTPPGGSVEDAYRHTYVMFNGAQTMPLYLVQFFWGPAPESGASSRPAAIMDLPSGVPPPNAATRDAMQALYDRYDFFDPVLYCPVSIRDKMVGTHASGEAASHKLIGIGDAYDAAVTESRKPDPLLAQRQTELRANLRAVDAKLREVNRNSTQIEENIWNALQEALFQLQDLTQKKMDVLLAEEVELRRQLQQIDWIETYLDMQRDEAPPVDFLNAWKCHVQLRGDLCASPLETETVLEQVAADLSLEGGVQVVSASRGGVTPPPPGTTARDPKARGQVGGAGAMVMEGEAVAQPPATAKPAGAAPVTLSPIKGPLRTATSPPNHPHVLPTNAALEQLDRIAGRSLTGASALGLGSGGSVLLSNQLLARPITFAGDDSYFNGEEAPPTPPSEKPAFKRRQARLQAANPTKSNLLGLWGRCPSSYVSYSLSLDGARRAKTVDVARIDPAWSFGDSKIVSSVPPPAAGEEGGTAPTGSPPLSEALALFLSIPYQGGRYVPRVRLLWSSPPGGRFTLEEALSSVRHEDRERQQGQFDPDDEEPQVPIPSIILASSGQARFGAYISDTLRTDGLAYGDHKSFLFSLDKDLKLPYHGRTPFVGYRLAPNTKFPAAYSTEQTLQIGVGDLTFNEDFTKCSSQLEGSFGLGLSPGSEATKTFLVGEESFACDRVEIWGVFM